MGDGTSLDDKAPVPSDDPYPEGMPGSPSPFEMAPRADPDAPLTGVLTEVEAANDVPPGPAVGPQPGDPDYHLPAE